MNEKAGIRLYFPIAAGDAIIKANLDSSLLDWKELCFGTVELFERPLSATRTGLPERLRAFGLLCLCSLTYSKEEYYVLHAVFIITVENTQTWLHLINSQKFKNISPRLSNTRFSVRISVWVKKNKTKQNPKPVRYG